VPPNFAGVADFWKLRGSAYTASVMLGQNVQELAAIQNGSRRKH
jgi:hypothetical protein